MKPLARHARSEIFVALRPEGVDRLCVVHMLAPELVDRPGVSDGLRAQASWLVVRVHGNLVQTYDVGHGGGRLFLLNEYVEGRDVGTLLHEAGRRQVVVPIPAAVFVALEVSAAIGFIRSTEERVTGVPTSLIGFSAASVIASREGTIKVVHHGSAVAPTVQSLAEKDVGRVSLIAPEHLQGGGSPRGDVFAVGALLWQMLTGKPLGGESAGEHLERLRSANFQAPRASAVVGPDRAIPPQLDDLLAAALAAKPEDRPVSCEALRAHLVSVVKGVGGAGSNALRALMSDLFTGALSAESAELAALSKIAEKELPRLAARPRAATLTNFDPMSIRGGTPSPLSRDSELPIGEVIPGTRYRVKEKLGEGGMGAVYLAEHVDIERRVALKLVHAELLRNPMVLGQFRQEARAASRIGNPYICDVTDWGELPDGRVFFVMEYLDGSSLGRILEQIRKLPPARCIPILRQVTKALGSAHEKGIVHLDVKPDNVLLVGKEGRADAVKVVDFGVAGILGQQGGSSRVMGTPEYMAPERATGKTYDHRSDVYSLGVMAYEMLVGEVPFQGPTPIETLSLQASEVPDRINERLRHPIPEALETVVMDMLEKSPSRRPQSMAEVEARLLEAQIEAGIRTPWDDLALPAVAPERAARIARKLRASTRRTVAIGAATAIAALGVIGIVAAVSQPPKVMTVTKLSAPTPRAEIAPMPAPAAAVPAAPVTPGRTTGGASGTAGAGPAGARGGSRGRRDEHPEEASEPRDPVASRQAAQRGQDALDFGRHEEAKVEFERALAADSRSLAAIRGLADVSYELADYNNAAYYANRVVRTSPRAIKYLVLLGDASFKIGRWSDALGAYQRAQKIDPELEGIDDRIKNVLVKLGRGPAK
ncbi:MAG TPA: protein kinase [Polyangia bacterium]|nr:protein kinase [Polyangia bacterium]